MCKKNRSKINFLSMTDTKSHSAGKVYMGVDRVPGGVVMTNNKGKVEVLPTDYVKKTFWNF